MVLLHQKSIIFLQCSHGFKKTGKRDTKVREWAVFCIPEVDYTIRMAMPTEKVILSGCPFIPLNSCLLGFFLSLLPYTEVSKLDCVCANIGVRCLFSEIMGFYECCSVHTNADVTSKNSYTLVLEMIFLALDLEILVLRDRLWLLSYCTGICSLSTAGAETTLFEVHGNSPTNF